MTCRRSGSKPAIVSALVWLLAAAPPFSGVALALQDAQSILATMKQKREERWQGVENYTIAKSVEASGGLQTPQYFVKMTVDGEPTFRLVPAPVYEREMAEKAGFPPPDPSFYDAMASGLDMLGGALMQGGGGPPPMPGVSQMTSAMSFFLRQGAAGMTHMDDGSLDATDALRDMGEFTRKATFAGTEPVLAESDGGEREAYKLVVDGLEMKQAADGGSFTLRSATLWVDREHYVPLRLLMEGDVQNGSETTPLTIEKLDLDYRTHGPLVVPHREVFRLSGILQAMSDEQRREMADAKTKLAEAEEQLRSLPPEQREMVERMMGGQLEQFKKMVEGENFETAMNVTSVSVNEGPPTPYGVGELFVGGVHFPGALTMAGEQDDESGQLVANLGIAAQQPAGTEVTLDLFGNGVFPSEGGSVAVADASGTVRYSDDRVVLVDSATGSILVLVRTETRIAGTFEASLTGTTGDGTPVTVNVSGRFDSGAPTGPYQPPRGSPIPTFFGVAR